MSLSSLSHAYDKASPYNGPLHGVPGDFDLSLLPFLGSNLLDG